MNNGNGIIPQPANSKWEWSQEIHDIQYGCVSQEESGRNSTTSESVGSGFLLLRLKLISRHVHITLFN